MVSCSFCEKLSPCVQLEALQEKFLSIIPCLFHVTPYKKEASTFFVANL